jgi:hypothetical protein
MRPNRRCGHAFALALLLIVTTSVSFAQAPGTRPARLRAAKESSKFLRYVPGAAGSGGRLETSIVTYRNADGVTVDLIGAVHIADAAYYEALNKRFDGYDAVLFEMVRPRDVAAPAGATTRPGATTAPARPRPGALRWVGALQRFMRDNLELEHQLESIDYDKPNFVHADLDAETFLEMQKARGESFTKMMIQVMLRELGKGPAAGANQPNLFELLAALQAPDRARQLKIVLAKQFEQMDDMLSGLEGPNGSVILTERNKAALKVLQDRIKHGDTKLAIFYGAGHFKGMEKILSEEMGFTQVGNPQWITAWDLTKQNTPTTRPSTGPSHLDENPHSVHHPRD